MSWRNSSFRFSCRSESTQVIWLTPKSWPAMWNSLKSVNSSSWMGLSSGAEAEKISRPSSSRDMPAMWASRWKICLSRGVLVGDLNMTVSETMAAAMSPASLAEGMSPRSVYIPATMVVVLPTGSLRK